MADNSCLKPKLYLHQDMQQGQLDDVAGGQAVVYSARCPARKRPTKTPPP